MSEFSGESAINRVSGVDAQPRFKVGDRVRVVLEGRVHDTDDGDFSIRSENGENYIEPAAAHVKSIEIIKPAKPSVADLPALSVVRAGPDVYVKAARDHWCIAGRPGIWTDEEVDRENWTLLVEKAASE